MKKQTEKKQNSRAMDEKRKPKEEENTPKSDKNWDPNKSSDSKKDKK